jgi:D-amino peptidase
VGETGINAAFCGTWDCPVVLVSGDEAACREARELLGPELETVAVKRGLGRFSARHLPPARARELIEAASRRALEKPERIAAYDPGSPCEIEVEFTTPDLIAHYRHRAGVETTGPLRIVSRADDWWSAWRQFFF